MSCVPSQLCDEIFLIRGKCRNYSCLRNVVMITHFDWLFFFSSALTGIPGGAKTRSFCPVQLIFRSRSYRFLSLLLLPLQSELFSIIFIAILHCTEYDISLYRELAYCICFTPTSSSHVSLCASNKLVVKLSIPLIDLWLPPKSIVRHYHIFTQPRFQNSQTAITTTWQCNVKS